MAISTEGYYILIVVSVAIIAGFVCCVGVRVVRSAPWTAPSSRPANEWQSLGVLETTAGDDEDMKRVLAWQAKYSPNTTQWIDVTQERIVQERGAGAWAFVENERMDETEEDNNAAVLDATTLVFCHGQGCLLTNLPLPTGHDFVYWEVKVEQLNNEDLLAIGLATKPYPTWRLPGWHKHSVAYHSRTGHIHTSNGLLGRPYDSPFVQGDVIGVGYISQTATVFFTRNGINLGKDCIGFRFPVFPVIGSMGPCRVSVNFGQAEFLFGYGNTRHAGLAPKQGSLEPPPAYGGHGRDTMLFEGTPADGDPNALAYSSAAPPPSYV